MKVILLENLAKIASIGEIIDVKRGFARTSAESTAYVILAQAKIDNIKSQEVLDKLSGVSVLTRQSSIDALRVLDRSLDRIHKERAKLGALMSRMEKAIDNLSNVALNTKASRGRIEDADFAKESARMTKAQILQQSAMAMIAQAGKAQQNVLQLLQQ